MMEIMVVVMDVKGDDDERRREHECCDLEMIGSNE
jgi:hypothetical protein